MEGLLGTASRCASPAGPTSGRYPPPRHKTRKARFAAGFCVVWQGWKDSNLRMAGSKRDRSQPNQQVADSTERLVPLHAPRFPFAATKPATSGWLRPDVLSRVAARRAIYGCRKPEAPYGICRLTPVRPQAPHPERSEGVAESRISSQQNLPSMHAQVTRAAPSRPHGDRRPSGRGSMLCSPTCARRIPMS